MGYGHNIKILLRQVSFYNTVVITVLILMSIIVGVLFAENVFTVVNEMFVQMFGCVSGLILGILGFSVGIPPKWATTKLGTPLAKAPFAEIF